LGSRIRLFFSNHRVRHGVSRGSRSTGTAKIDNSTVAFSGGIETIQSAATAYDADISAICVAQDHLKRHPSHKITILSPNLAAIQSDNKPPASHGPILCSRILHHADSKNFPITPHLPPNPRSQEWSDAPSPPKPTRPTLFLRNYRPPHTLTYLTESAKELAISAWQVRWHKTPRRTQAYWPFAHLQTRISRQLSKAHREVQDTSPSHSWASPQAMPSSSLTHPVSILASEPVTRDVGPTPRPSSMSSNTARSTKSSSRPRHIDSPRFVSVDTLLHQERRQGIHNLPGKDESPFQAVRGFELWIVTRWLSCFSQRHRLLVQVIPLSEEEAAQVWLPTRLGIGP
jgi:hypothetical protein